MKKLTRIFSFVVTFLLLSLIMSAGMPVVLASTHLPVTVYVDGDFSGTAQEFDVGNHNYNELTAAGGVGNDSISSIRVAPGYKVTLYQDADFLGATRILTADDNILSDFNDNTSSLKVETISPLDSTCIQVSAFDDAAKLSLLQTFAPKIWMASGETYWSSSVEWAQPNLQRYLNTTENKYCYKTLQTLSSPTQKLPYFSGSQASAVAYSFWTEKEYGNVDLSYWQYCPYNYGKVVWGMEFGDHVSDWEHITVRLAKFTYNGANYVKPTLVCYPAHSFVNTYTWGEVSKVNTTHVVGYCAKGSHGMWKDSGNHVYKNIVIAQLTDVCSAGTAWDTWNTLSTFEYFPATRTGRGIGTTAWPAYFNTDYTNASGGAIYIWGNEAWGSAFGQPILDSGPNGPEGHDALYDGTILR